MLNPVEFAGPRGLTLRGERSDAGDHWTVLVHGEGRDLDAWRPLAMWLGERGFSALAFDLPFTLWVRAPGRSRPSPQQRARRNRSHR
ncbi:MAG: hypothetical protein AUI15_16920 [Actinobacteria bacterium 13_2_20CM_2_66_6]|nr:MAG: hypothetical protein AUI15_16920 [Actinobacteria bacterium 13_2_20CM_2_66_6]